MMREDQVLTATVDIDGFTQMFVNHRGTFNMPAWTTLTPAGRPMWFSRFCGFPQYKVQRIFLVFANTDSSTAFKLFQWLMGQFAVTRIFLGAEQNVAVCFVSKALVFEGFHDVFDLIDGFGCLWMNGCFADTKAFGIGQVFVDVTLCDFLCSYAFFVCLFDDLVIDVGKVLDKGNIVSFKFQISAHSVKYTDWTCVADVDKVIYSRSAGIHFYLALLDRHKFFFFSG